MSIELTNAPQETPTADENEAPLGMEKRKRRLKVRVPRISRSDLIASVLLVFILIAGAYLRFTGQNWDDFTHLHPDERFLTGVVDRLGEGFDPTGNDAERLLQLQLCEARYPQTNGAAPSIFDSQCSSWYPKNSGHGAYSYGELPLFIVKIAADLTAASSGDIEWTRYNGVHLVGRSVNAVADLSRSSPCF